MNPQRKHALLVTWSATVILCAVSFCCQAVAAEKKVDTQNQLPQNPLAFPEIPGTYGIFGANYWYLPYAVLNEEQAVAFVNAFKSVLKEGKRPDFELTVPKGKGYGDGNKLYRIHHGIADKINAESKTTASTSNIPLVIAQPEPNARGANVLYLDGHVDFKLWGQFPVTHNVIDALKTVDPKGPQE